MQREFAKLVLEMPWDACRAPMHPKAFFDDSEMDLAALWQMRGGAAEPASRLQAAGCQTLLPLGVCYSTSFRLAEKFASYASCLRTGYLGRWTHLSAGLRKAMRCTQ